MILISVDTLRADHLGAYGYGRETSPFLDQLADSGVVFDRAYSTASWTKPSHASMLTGLYPRHHGMRGGTKRSPTAMPEDVETLAEALKRSGYATAGFSNMLYLSAANGFSRGFDTWHQIKDARDAVGAMPTLTFRVLDWLDEAGDEPFFVFLHVYDVHTRYQPLPKYRDLFVQEYTGPAKLGDERALIAHRAGRHKLGEADAEHLVNLYDAEIRQFDAALRRFFAMLSQAGVLEDTTVFITSDHGEEFLDHGDFLHGRTLYEELVRIPWIAAGACIPAGVRVAAPVSLVDVVPTTLGVLGATGLQHEVDGMDVSPWWEDPSAGLDRPLFMESDEWNGSHKRDFRRAVVIGDRKLHLDGRTGRHELYDLRSDPKEQHDLLPAGEEAPELARALYEFMKTPERTGPGVPPPRGKALRRLRALGYVE